MSLELKELIITLFPFYYILCLVYCVWRFVVRYKKTSLDGVTGMSPGLDVLIAVFFGWIFAPVDVVITGINKIRNKTE